MSLDVLVVGWRDQPIAGAVVALVPNTEERETQTDAQGIRTDERGWARLAGIRRADAELRVVAPGYAEGATSLGDLQAGEERRVRVELQPVGTLRGRVVRAADRAPLAGARVILREAPLGSLYRSEDWGEYFTTRDPIACDSDGGFSFEKLRIGAGYAVWVEAPGFDRGEREVVLLRPDSAPELEIALVPAGSVAVRVVDTFDQPVEGYWVVLVPEDVFVRQETSGRRRSSLVDLDAVVAGREVPGSTDGATEDDLALWMIGDGLRCGSWFPPNSTPLLGARTDARGHAVISGLAVGRTFRVDPSPIGFVFENDDWRSLWGDPPLRVEARAAAPPAELTLRVAATATVRVRCVDAAGQPVAGIPNVTWKGAVVHPSSQDGPLHEVRCTRLAPGAGELLCHLTGHTPRRVTLHLAPGSDTLVEVPLATSPALRGRVVDEAGVPHARGSVTLGEGEEVAEILEDGSFELPMHGPGVVQLRVSSPDADRPLEVSVQAPTSASREPITITLPRGVRGRVLASLPPALLVGEDEERGYLRLEAIPSHGGPMRLDDRGDVDADAWAGGRHTWSVAPGAYVLTCLVRGCAVLRKRVEVEAGAVTDLGLLAVPQPPPADVLVELADGRPAPYARVRLEGYELREADGWGRVRLAHGPTERLRAIVGGKGYLALEQQVAAAPAGEPLRLRARRGAVLEGSVSATGPREAFELRIEALGEGARAPRTPTLIDSAWKFEADLAPGRYRVSLLEGGAVRASTEVALTEEGRASVALRARPGR